MPSSLLSTSKYLYPLSYASTVLLVSIVALLAWIATDLQRFERQCKVQMDAFQSYEQSAWADIVTLERIHTRTKRDDDVYSIPKRRKARRSKLRKTVKTPKPFIKQYVPVAEELSELDEYRNSDWHKEDDETEEEATTTTSTSTAPPTSSTSEAKDVEDISSTEKKEETDEYSEEEDVEKKANGSEQIRNMSTRSMKMEQYATGGGLAQLLEVHNDGDEEDVEDEEDEEDVEGGTNTNGEEEEEEEEGDGCADTDLKCYGNPCPRGPPGPPGFPGPPGEDGTDGVDGNNGTSWELHAEDRVIVLGCVKCPPGPRGIEGDPGPPGDKGGVGKNGEPGLDGYEGFPGQTGPEGEAGYDGEYGADGWPGQRGEDSKIYRNWPGPPGPPGVAGPPGETGDDGGVGKQGGEGIAGVVGGPGEHGIPGPPGAPGAPGEAGLPGGHVGQCKCPERGRRPYPIGGGGGYVLPPRGYLDQPRGPLPPYPYPDEDYRISTSEGVYYTTSSEYPTSTEAPYSEEPPTTSVYRYFVKAAAPGYQKASTPSEYVEEVTTTTSSDSENQEKESLYIEGFHKSSEQVPTSDHLAESFEPPEDHPTIMHQKRN